MIFEQNDFQIILFNKIIVDQKLDQSVKYRSTVQIYFLESVLANSSPSCREEIIYNAACPVHS
jgi:hypothetical protein